MLVLSWILALVGGALAFVLAAGSAAGMIRRMDLYAALAATPLPALAIYFSAPELLATLRNSPSPRDLLFPGGPLFIACITLVGTFASLHQQTSGGRRGWR